MVNQESPDKRYHPEGNGQRVQELGKTNRMKSKLPAAMAHELRSLVNAIIGLVELVRTAADKVSNRERSGSHL